MLIEQRKLLCRWLPAERLFVQELMVLVGARVVPPVHGLLQGVFGMIPSQPEAGLGYPSG